MQRAAGEESLQQVTIRRPVGPAGVRETVPGQVNKIERREAVDIEELRLARRGAYPRERAAAGQGVEERGFSDVRPADQREFGERRIESLQRVGERPDERGRGQASFFCRERSVMISGDAP